MSSEVVNTEAGQPVRPYITSEGNLIIPFDADEKYHYWRGGQSLASTLLELDAPFEVWRRYTAPDENLYTATAPDKCLRCDKPLALACGGALKVCVKCNRYRDATIPAGTGEVL